MRKFGGITPKVVGTMWVAKRCMSKTVSYGESITKTRRRFLRNHAASHPDNDTITGGEIAACVDLTEYAALTAINREYLNTMIQAGAVPLTNAARASLRAVFANGTGSRTRITNLLRKVGSRAEELGLKGVTESDVADAKRLP